MDLISFLSLPFAKYVAVPVISTLVGTFFQYNCYSDRYNFKGRDLFYWAPGMLATTLLLICVEYSNKVTLGNLTSEEKIVAGNQFYSAVILVICVYFIINTILRKKGRNVIEDNMESLVGNIGARLDMCCYALVCLANIRLKMKFTFKNIFVIFVLVTIVYESLYLYKTIVWDKSKIIGIIVFVVSLVLTSVILATYLMSYRYRYKQYYISFPQEFERDINEFRINSMISPQYGTDTLRPGKDISKEIKKKISHCSICLVIISKKISTMQKIEISEMRAKHKKIIPILVDGGKLPSSLSKIVPICTTADQLSKVSLEEQLS